MATRCVVAVGLAWLGCTGAWAAPAPGPSVAPVARAEARGVERVVVFADVHGAYDELTRLLRESNVIDADGRWAAGRAHVVSLGDLLDRGADSRRVMDLLMRLQAESTRTGGALHVVLGNHEAMNLLGDLRYVLPGEFAAYLDLEPEGLRARRRADWLEANGAESGPEFDRQFPPGWFGHRAALAPDGRYGRWLLGLPVAVVVNDSLFMHAGPSTALQGLSLDDLNARYRSALVDYLRLAGELERGQLIRDDDPFNDRARLAGERLRSGAAPAPALQSAVQEFARVDEHPLLRPEGPNWYRGAALCHQVAEHDVLAPLLEQFRVARVVVGHTLARDLRAATRFDGRLVKLDTGMNTAVYKGRGAVLTIEGPKLQVRYLGDAEPATLEPEALYVAPNSIDDDAVRTALEAGTITASGPRAPGEIDVVVEHRGKRIPAVFQQRNAAAAQREVAAARLDRVLGLGVVPATVDRDVQGQRGVLQARPLKWVTQADVERQSLRGSGWCALEPQFQLVYVLDALLGNEARTPETLLFDASEWFVYATRHERAFGNSRALPAYLKAAPPRPGAELRRRLEQLDDETLTAALGDALDPRARKALLARRDALLALPATATGTAR